MLYVVGTPIGNLKDLSFRQAETIAQADIILTEDTRSISAIYKAITTYFKMPINPSQRTISYYKEKEFEKLPEVINFLKEDKKVVLVSESGMPLISDPGFLLVKTVIKQNLPYTVIPGPTAITTALVASGFNPSPLSDKTTGGFMFLGFLPKKSTHLLQLFNRLQLVRKIFPETIFVFYESPHRIKSSLQCFDTLKCDAEIVVCRELTKKFEEIVRGKAKDLMNRDYKGEIVLLIKF